MLNGTRYIGHSRPKGNSSFLETTDAKEGISEQDGETTKEQNRRLLLQERNAHAGRKKVTKRKGSIRRFNQTLTLQTVKEDVSVEGTSGATDVAEAEESSTCDCLLELNPALRKKARRSGNTTGFRRPNRKEIKVRGPSVRGVAVEY